MAEIIRLSISEAAKFFGVNPQTIRRAVKDQEVTYVVVRGRYHLNFESVLRWSQKRATVKNKFATRGIGQYVDKWKIRNPLFSPNPKLVKKGEEKNSKETGNATDAKKGVKNQQNTSQTDNI